MLFSRPLPYSEFLACGNHFLPLAFSPPQGQKARRKQIDLVATS
jgi:hypothetical protein